MYEKGINDERIDYDLAFATVEKFTIDSGIRHFCADVCKGRCCGSSTELHRTCFTSPKTNCRKLGCAAFLCLDLILIIDPKQLIKNYKATNHIYEVASDIQIYENVGYRSSIYYGNIENEKLFAKHGTFLPSLMFPFFGQLNMEDVKASLDKAIENPPSWLAYRIKEMKGGVA